MLLCALCLLGTVSFAKQKPKPTFDIEKTQQEMEAAEEQQNPFYPYSWNFRIYRTNDSEVYHYFPDDKKFQEGRYDSISLALYHYNYDKMKSLLEEEDYIPEQGEDVYVARALWLTIRNYLVKKESQIDTMNILARYGVDFNQYVDNSDTPLILAIFCGDKQMVEWLLDHQADMEKSSRTKMFTPLLMAATYGQVDIVKLLLEKGAEVNTKNAHGWTPLMGASMCLGAEDAQFHAKSKSFAKQVWKNCREIAALLRPLTTDPQERDEYGKNADDYASMIANQMYPPMEQLSVRPKNKPHVAEQKGF